MAGRWPTAERRKARRAPQNGGQSTWNDAIVRILEKLFVRECAPQRRRSGKKLRNKNGMPEMCNKQWKHSQHAQLHTAERHARRTLSLLLNAPESRIAGFPFRCVLEPNINHVLEMRNSYEGNVSAETARRIQKRMRQQNGEKKLEKRKNIPICLPERLRGVRADWMQSEQGATSMGCWLESLIEKVLLPGRM